MAAQKKNLLLVLTSCDTLLNGKGKTGWYLPELAHPYNVFAPSFNLTIASPAGGPAPLDPGSAQMFKDDEGCKQFLANEKAQQLVKNTVRLDSVKAADFDAIFYVGGHGPVIDLPVDTVSQNLIQDFYSAGKITAAVCHAPAVFIHTKKADGTPLIAGKKFTGFSNSEERAVGGVDSIPFLLEDELSKLGGIYEKTEDWGIKVVVDTNGGLLYTGQNPASAEPLAERIKADLLA